MVASRMFCALLIVAAAAGCAGAITTADGERLRLTSPAFREYVERVFREQNGVGSELAFALEGEADAGADLARAEDELLTACAGLNRLATARRDRQSLGPAERARSARSAPACEVATANARAALERAAR